MRGNYIPGEGSTMGRPSVPISPQTQQFIDMHKAMWDAVWHDRGLGDVVIHQILADALAGRRLALEQGYGK